MVASHEEIELVLARLELMSDNIKLLIGSAGAYSKEQLIEHVKENDEIGQLVVDAHMAYLRSFKQENRFLYLKPKVMAAR